MNDLIKDPKQTQPMAEELQKIGKAERVADEIRDQSLLALFEESTDFKSLIIRKENYENLEIITDQMKRAGHVLGSISIKYA